MGLKYKPYLRITYFQSEIEHNNEDIIVEDEKTIDKILKLANKICKCCNKKKVSSYNFICDECAEEQEVKPYGRYCEGCNADLFNDNCKCGEGKK